MQQISFTNNNAAQYNQQKVDSTKVSKNVAINELDTFENKNQKNKKNQKILFFLGAFATAIIATNLIIKHKFGQPKQLAEYIEFKSAKTIEEAAQFAKQNLGTKIFRIKDLDVANWTNEGLTHINNKTKGKAKMPRIITYTSNFPKKYDVAATMNAFGILRINKTCIESNKAKIEGSFKDLRTAMKKMFGGKDLDEFYVIFHEQGHLEHSKSAKNFHTLANPEELKRRGEKPSEEVKDFMDNHLETAEKVSDYAMTSPNEFVADTYAKMLSGHKFPHDVMELYKKFNGPMI